MSKTSNGQAGRGFGAAPWLDDYSRYPVIQPRKIHYMPHRAGAFGNAEFKHPTSDLDGPSSFDVIAWADDDKRRCAKRKAKYAVVITCLTPALMVLSSND